MALVVFLWLTAFGQAAADKQVVFSITGHDLSGGVVSEVTWDGDTLMIQGVFADPSGGLSAKYFVKPADRMTVERRDRQTAGSLDYWNMKSRRISPTGVGRITVSTDTKLPMYGIASQDRRFADSVDMGGTVNTHTVRLRDREIFRRTGPVPPYDGEVWAWSPAELNRIAYVDGKGDLWVAMADGANPERVLRGNFLLPAWSADGRMIAVAERRKDRWDISVVHLPPHLRQ